MDSANQDQLRTACHADHELSRPFFGRTVRDVASKADAQFDCIRAGGEAYPNFVVLAPMDLSIEAEAFGCRFTFHDGAGRTAGGSCDHVPAYMEA